MPTPAKRTTRKIIAQPCGSGPASPLFQLNHLFAAGRKSRTHGATRRNSATAPTAAAEGDADTIAPNRQIDKRSECGAKNQTRRPRRSERTMPKDSASGNNEESASGKSRERDVCRQSPPRRHASTKAGMIRETASATYVQPSTSTVLTDNGFCGGTRASVLVSSMPGSLPYLAPPRNEVTSHRERTIFSRF